MWQQCGGVMASMAMHQQRISAWLYAGGIYVGVMSRSEMGVAHNVSSVNRRQ